MQDRSIELPARLEAVHRTLMEVINQNLELKAMNITLANNLQSNLTAITELEAQVATLKDSLAVSVT